MPWNPEIPPDVRTDHLGEFTPEHAEQLAEAFDAQGIIWWTKEQGFVNQIWQLGVEMFVDRASLERARAIARSVLAASP